MPKFNLKLSKTLISNFAYVDSERRKLDIFILFQKFQFGYRNKVNPPPIGYLHDGVILLLRPEFFWVSFSYLNLKAPVRFQ